MFRIVGRQNATVWPALFSQMGWANDRTVLYRLLNLIKGSVKNLCVSTETLRQCSGGPPDAGDDGLPVVGLDTSIKRLAGLPSDKPRALF